MDNITNTSKCTSHQSALEIIRKLLHICHFYFEGQTNWNIVSYDSNKTDSEHSDPESDYINKVLA